ncbi:hypothetical protein LOAG_03337, partial [Loa loa]
LRPHCALDARVTKGKKEEGGKGEGGGYSGCRGVLYGVLEVDGKCCKWRVVLGDTEHTCHKT